MFSIICVYCNKEILEKYLLESLKNQTTDYELILVDNTVGQFKSAAGALNYGVKQIKNDSKYIMFVHQDVDLCSNKWLANAEKILETVPNLGIAGAAGAREGKDSGKLEVVTNIKHGIPPRSAGEVSLRRPEKVQTLDEALIIIPKSVFDILQFDEKTCNDWHLYGVDYALSVKRLNLDAYVMPIFIYHRSTGSSNKNYFQIILSLGVLPEGYYQTLNKLLKKHKNSFKQIYTTCGNWNTYCPLILQKAWKINRGGVKFLSRRLSKKNLMF